MADIIEMGKEEGFSTENELLERLLGVCAEYHTELSNASILGILELAKTNIIMEVSDD